MDQETGRDTGSGWLRTDVAGDALVVTIGGDWLIDSIGALDPALRRLDPGRARTAIVDLSELDALDTAGAWVLHRTVAALERRGIATRLAGVHPGHATLLDEVEKSDKPHEMEPPRISAFVRILGELGEATFDVFREARNLLNFFGLTLVTVGRAVAAPRRIRLTATISHMERVGLDALPIIGLLSFLIGVVLAFQGADQLRRFGAEVFTVNLLGVASLREMGALLTAIMVAGRSGSAFTAQIGTMKINQEVDAMLTIGLDPMEVLVLPRLIALMVTMPLLVFFADIMCLAGGALMVIGTLDISFWQFIKQLEGAVTISTFWVGMVKAPVFAFLIGMVGCYEGLKVSGSAESVGRLTTQAVVESIFLVILVDAAFSVLFSYMGI